MNERFKELMAQAGFDPSSIERMGVMPNAEKFAELIVQDYANKTIQALMRDPAFVQAMDEYYERKWAHRFD